MRKGFKHNAKENYQNTRKEEKNREKLQKQPENN